MVAGMTDVQSVRNYVTHAVSIYSVFLSLFGSLSQIRPMTLFRDAIGVRNTRKFKIRNNRYNEYDIVMI